jgi:hypothetical protein
MSEDRESVRNTNKGKTMKRIFLLAAGLLLVFLTGCMVTSVYPFYTPKDVEFDPALLGVWRDSANTNTDQETWTFHQADARAYKLIIADTDKTTEYQAHLFQLKGRRFLDACPVDRPDDFVPPHYLLKVMHREAQLELAPLSYQWLEELLKEKPKAVRHLVVETRSGDSSSQRLVLTAGTAELQRFILRNADNQAAFGDSVTLKHQ